MSYLQDEIKFEVFDCPFLSVKDAAFYFQIYDFKQILPIIKKGIVANSIYLIFLDLYYVPIAPKVHRIHDLYIYGYDDFKGELHITEFLGGAGKFCFTTIPYTNFYESLESIKALDLTYLNASYVLTEHNINIKPYRFHIDLLYSEVMHFSDSTLSSSMQESFEIYSKKYKNICGLSIYLWLFDYISKLKNSNGEIFLRDVYILKMQKKCIVERLLYLNNFNNSINFTDKLIELYRCAYQMTEILLQIAIKYNITKSDHLADKILSKILELYEFDQKITQIFLNEIEMQ
jgi:hypothetical protein